MIGIAVVGAGRWGPHLIRNFHDHPKCRVVSVVDTDHERREWIAGRFDGVVVTDDLDLALADARVDAVVIATPTATHENIVRRSLDAGKHVLVEKPLTNDLRSAVELAHQAETRGVVLMVGHVFLFNPSVRAAKGRIDSGDLGGLRYMSMVRTNLGPVRSDVNAAWDLASHDVSVANFLLDSSPVSASATGGAWLSNSVHDAVFVTLEYPERVLVHIEASWLNPRKRRFIAVVGDSKMLTIDDMDLNEPLRIYDKGVENSRHGQTDTFAAFRATIREGEVTIPRVTLGEPLREECDAFVRRMLGEVDSASDGWAGVEVVRALEAVQRSLAMGGSPVELERLE